MNKGYKWTKERRARFEAARKIQLVRKSPKLTNPSVQTAIDKLLQKRLQIDIAIALLRDVL